MSFQDVINQQILNHYLSLDDNGFFVCPPRTNDELDEFIRAAFGIFLPRKSITPGHSTPFEFISDLFFERVKNALGFANRLGGKTFSIAICNLLDMMFKPNCEIASAGAIKAQAEKCYRYFSGFLEFSWFQKLNVEFRKRTGVDFCGIRDSIQSRTIFGNGSRMEIITGSEKGFRSPHPHKARIDEIDDIPWEILQIGLSMAHSSFGIRGQNVFTSTRQQQAGSMQRLLDESVEKGIKVYEWNVWEAVQRCPRRCIDDPEHGSCKIYSFCKGTAHRCAGHFEIDDFINQVSLLDRITFETEWLNKLPSKHKSVYYMLDTKHIMTPERLYAMYGRTEIDFAWEKVSGVDFGSSPGHPFVYVKFCKLPDGAYLLFYEYIAEQKLMRDHARAVKSSPFWHSNEIIYSDWGPQDRLELRNEGIRTRQAVKGPGSVNMGIDLICELLLGKPPDERPELYFWHECRGSMKEISMYAWPLSADGRLDKTGNPEKRNDNVSDAMRMALYSSRCMGKHKYRPRRLTGI